MPMSERIFSRSGSDIVSTRWPFTVTSPASGRNRPRTSLRITDLPEPLGPSRTRIDPAGTVKLRSFKTT